MALVLNGDNKTVLQVVGTENTTVTTMSTSGGLGTFSPISGHTVTITPSSLSSKILVFYQSALVQNNEANNALFLQLLRNSTAVGTGVGGSTANVTGAVPTTFNAEYYVTGSMGHSFIMYMDTPATVSPITYSIQIATRVSTTVYINSGSNSSAYRSMTKFYAMEISG